MYCSKKKQSRFPTLILFGQRVRLEMNSYLNGNCASVPVLCTAPANLASVALEAAVRALLLWPAAAAALEAVAPAAPVVLGLSEANPPLPAQTARQKGSRRRRGLAAGRVLLLRGHGGGG